LTLNGVDHINRLDNYIGDEMGIRSTDLVVHFDRHFGAGSEEGERVQEQKAKRDVNCRTIAAFRDQLTTTTAMMMMVVAGAQPWQH
jgi:hypothetical protein